MDPMLVSTISNWELVGRLALALVLCGVIGLERELRDQAAGLRTHILVGVGAALFTLISAYGFPDFRAAQTEIGGVIDPSRIAAQIVTGIGFLGAGAIMRQGITIRGLTTAAALWISAAVGMAVGAGYYVGALVTTGVVLIALAGLFKPGLMLSKRRRQESVVIELATSKRKRIHEALELLARNEIQIQDLKASDEGTTHHLRIEARVGDEDLVNRVVQALRVMPDVDECSARSIRREFG